MMARRFSTPSGRSILAMMRGGRCTWACPSAFSTISRSSITSAAVPAKLSAIQSTPSPTAKAASARSLSVSAGIGSSV